MATKVYGEAIKFLIEGAGGASYTVKVTPWIQYSISTNSATTYIVTVYPGFNVYKPAGCTFNSTINGYIQGTNKTAITKTRTVAIKNNNVVNTSYQLSNSFTWEWPKTHAAQTVTISLDCNYYLTNTDPAKQTFSISPKSSYNVTYNANSGSGAPSTQKKWHGEALTLSSTRPTKSEYNFKGWATSSNNAIIGSVAYNPGNTYSSDAALSLYAVWDLIYSKPSITNLKIERCKANGDLYDEGTYAKVSFNWSVFRSSKGRYYGGTASFADNRGDLCKINVGGVTTSFTLSDSQSSGSVSKVIGTASSNFNINTKYDASVTITDSQTVYNGAAKTTTKTGVLATTAFPIDFNADATAVGFLQAAPDNATGIYCGKDLYIKGSKVVDYVVSTGSGSASNAYWTWRKWASGKTEAWGSYAPSSAVSTSVWVSPIRYKDLTISIPSGVFSSTPGRIYGTSFNNQLWVVHAIGESATSITCRVATLSSNNVTMYIRLYCVSS